MALHLLTRSDEHDRPAPGSPATPRHRAARRRSGPRASLFGGLAVSVAVLASLGSLLAGTASREGDTAAAPDLPAATPTPAPTAVAPVTPAAGPPGSTGTWTSVFSDEFDGTSIDRSTWRVNRYGGTSQDGAFNPDIEGAYYSPDNVSVVDGAAVLTFRSDPATVDGRAYTHSSGTISSQGAFQLQDGDYVEARVLVPTGDGLWPAFWTLPEDRWPPEIDIFEFFDTSQRALPEFVYHAPDGSVPAPSAGREYGDPAVEYRDSWHTYGMLRSGGRLVPYLDGVAHPENGVAVGADALPQFIVLNLAMYAGHQPVDGTAMRIDWVRAWHRQ